MAGTALFLCPRCGVQKRQEVPLKGFVCPDEHRLVGLDFPADHRWCFCTECRFFFYIGDPEEPTVIVRVPDRCPSRKALQKYVRAIHCPSCGVLSLFTQPPPQDQVPPCPGCGNPIGLPLFRHRCEHIPEGLEYLTKRTECPFCGETFRPVEAQAQPPAPAQRPPDQPAVTAPVQAPPTPPPKAQEPPQQPLLVRTTPPPLQPPQTPSSPPPPETPQKPLLVRTTPPPQAAQAPPAPPPAETAQKPLLVRTTPPQAPAQAAPPATPAAAAPPKPTPTKSPPAQVAAPPPAAVQARPPAPPVAAQLKPSAPPAVVPAKVPAPPAAQKPEAEKAGQSLGHMTLIWLFFPFIFLYRVTHAALQKRSAWGLSLLALIATFALGTGIVFGVKHYFLDAFPRQFMSAIQDDRILDPPGDCALDLYAEEKAKDPADPTLPGAMEELKVRLLPEGEKAFTAFAAGNEQGIDWGKIERIYTFLSDTFPAETDYSASRAFARGQHAFVLKSYPIALDQFRVALSYRKDWPLALTGAGKALLRADAPVRDETLALRYFEQASKVDPKFPWGYRNISDYYADKGNVVAAEAYMRKAVAADPSQPSNLLRLGDLCLQQGKNGEAERFYRMSLLNEKDPAQRQKLQEKIAKLGSRSPRPTK